MALYNKMRPKTLSEFKGQELAVDTIRGFFKSDVRPNALLFVGVRGTGKTSMARVYAKQVNCLAPTEDGPCGKCASCQDDIDIIELDAASHSGVADIRELVESMQYAGTKRAKVYIIDEIHMLSTAAFNALLKPLEEPPQNTYFVFCTTEAHKVPLTIKSRCVKVDFLRISEEVIFDSLKEICDSAQVSYEEDALKIIARSAGGAMRDAQSILEQFLSEGRITAVGVSERLGVSTEEAVFQTIAGIARKEPMLALESLREMATRGRNLNVFLTDICAVLRDVIYVHHTGDTREVVNTSAYKDGIKSLAEEVSVSDALYYIDALSSVATAGANEDISCLVEITLLKLIGGQSELQQLRERVEKLEQMVSSAQITALPVADDVADAAAGDGWSDFEEDVPFDEDIPASGSVPVQPVPQHVTLQSDVTDDDIPDFMGDVAAEPIRLTAPEPSSESEDEDSEDDDLWEEFFDFPL